MIYYYILYIEHIIIWVPILLSLIIFILTVLILTHLLLSNLCDYILDNLDNKYCQIKLALLLQKQYKKKKLINKLESIIPIIEEIYYTPGFKGFNLCKQRFEKINKVF
jgi:hypothetical protein